MGERHVLCDGSPDRRTYYRLFPRTIGAGATVGVAIAAGQSPRPRFRRCGKYLVSPCSQWPSRDRNGRPWCLQCDRCFADDDPAPWGDALI